MLVTENEGNLEEGAGDFPEGRDIDQPVALRFENRLIARTHHAVSEEVEDLQREDGILTSLQAGGVGPLVRGQGRRENDQQGQEGEMTRKHGSVHRRGV